MIDKPDQYATLRQEALDSINSRDNFIVAMYTITVAILCVAFELENSILFLLPYIVIYAFQQNIANKTENMIVLGSYIAVYLEEGNGWESDNIRLKRDVMKTGKEFPRAKGIMSALVGRVGARQLGLWCSISCLIYSVADLLNIIGPCDSAKMMWKVLCSFPDGTVKPIVCIILSVILYILLRIQTRNALNTGERRSIYIKRLKADRAESLELSNR